MNATRSLGALTLACWCVAGLAQSACGSGGADAPEFQPEQEQEPEQAELDPRQILVRPAPDEDIGAILQDIGLDDAGGTLLGEIRGTDFYLVALPDEQSVNDFLARLRGDARVLEGERDRVLSSPEGSGATLPIGHEILDFSVVPDQPELQRIGAPIARTRATGAGMRVAVIDSGVVTTHQSLTDRLELSGWDFVDDDDDPSDVPNGEDDDQDGLIDEGFGHGTFVSSLILAVAPDVMIVPYRVLNSDSTGLASDVAEAIIMATDNGVDLINLSLGMEHRNLVVGQAMVYARDAGVMVVASGGNTGNSEVTFPASISIAASVASVNESDFKAFFTSFGNDVDICAPGFELIGAYPVADNAAVRWSGTSFSAATVAGAVCLVRELHPAWSSLNALIHVQNTSNEDVLALNGDFGPLLGEGRLDLDAATK